MPDPAAASVFFHVVSHRYEHGHPTLVTTNRSLPDWGRVFGDACPPVTAFKWAIGHLIAAAGIVETTLALAALRSKRVPGIATLESVDPSCAGIPMTRSRQEPRSDIALVLCRGFAATDAALLVRAA